MKRLIDIVGSLAGLVLLSPLFLVLSLLILAKLGRPVFFSQERGGFQGSRFQLYKFRSMSNAVDEQGDLLPDKARLGLFGSFLRRTSLDELPSLWCVLNGKMSLVGPRPFISDYLSLYTSYQARRHEMKPGITGWAQVKGRNAISWEEKFDLDIWYVEHHSFWLDMRILLMTLARVFDRSGIASDDEVTGSRFLGTTAADENHDRTNRLPADYI